ncbi:MAG: preprotein translocase subunit SecE [Xanthomonadales bacterium]|nr:preprotein translocase subunit SecE [Xanthomonadales bacterium]
MSGKMEGARAATAGDWLKLGLAAVLAAAGVGQFFYFAGLPAGWRWVALLVCVAAAGALALFSDRGRPAREFLSEAHFELRKVVWPTRQETLQTTLVIVVVVIVVAIVLWVIDSILAWGIRALLGA